MSSPRAAFAAEAAAQRLKCKHSELSRIRYYYFFPLAFETMTLFITSALTLSRRWVAKFLSLSKTQVKHPLSMFCSRCTAPQHCLFHQLFWSRKKTNRRKKQIYFPALSLINISRHLPMTNNNNNKHAEAFLSQKQRWHGIENETAFFSDRAFQRFSITR